jgi:hypothetical protein
MTLTVATGVTLLAGTQIGHQRIPGVLVHGADRAQKELKIQGIAGALLEATQQALTAKVGGVSSEPPMTGKYGAGVRALR